MLMANDEIKETHTLSLEEQNISIKGNSYRREMITQETKFAIQKYEEYKRKVLMRGSNGVRVKKINEIDR